jgi:hypothetical protein
MTVFFPRTKTHKPNQDRIEFDWKKDFAGGFETENLPTMIYQHMSDNSDFTEEENYSASQDPQLKGYEDFMHLFYFSKSQAETSALISKYQKHQELNYSSPWHYLGALTGAALDPSSAFFFTKFGNVGKIVGTSMVGEELFKQNIDPIRDDKLLPIVTAWGYTLPYVFSKLSSVPSFKTQKKIKELDNYYNGTSTNIKETDIAIDGTFINPNKTDPMPSSVGADVSGQPIKQTAKKQMHGEEFVKTNLGIFGEDGPWNPVFRVIKQKTSLTARKMMGDLLDTPLLKLKNTKAWGFNATGKSVETDMRMMRVGEIQSHKMVKDQYLKYVQRQQTETGASVPKTDFFMMFKNRGKQAQSEGWLNETQFAKEISIARLNSFDHAIPEVAEAARITQKQVYEPLFKEANELKIREIPVQSELNFWNQQLKNLRQKKQGSVTFKSKYGDPDEVYSLSRIESNIDKLTKRLKNIQEGSGVKDYINIVYIKNAIDKNKDHFRGIIERFYARKGIQINKADLDQLVKDLSNHFPFKKPPGKNYDANQRYVFKDPRYARANRARELNLDKQAQLELIEAGMIMSDIFALQKIYARQMIPDILLTRKYGDPNGLGFRFIDEGEMSGFNPGLMTVANEYNIKMAMGKKVNRSKLLKERDKVLDDLEAGIELIKGTYGLPANPHSWTSTAMRTMKHWNALSMLTGFFAAIPDVARITMTSGIKRGFKTQFEMFSDFLGNGKIFKMGKKEAQSFGEAVDMVTGQRAMLFADVGDMFGLANRLEGAVGKVSAINFMYINLMSRWTEMAKSMASVTIGSRIIEDSIAWGKGGLSDKWKTALSSSGIDEAMAKRIANQFEKHGTKTKNNFMANTSEWTDTQAIDAFGAALNKDINITIVTPGLGDTPKWMSKELGSTIAQFKKFAMSATQRMLMRGMQEKDLDFLFGSMLLMGSGMLIDGIYHKYRFNRDYSKLSLTQKLLNAFDRSGLAGIYTDVNKAIETLTDNRIGISPMLGEKKPYGSSGRWKAGTILGPTGGQIYNIADILYDVYGNKYNHHTAKNVRRLIPFQNVWYLDWLFDDIQKGLNFK